MFLPETCRQCRLLQIGKTCRRRTLLVVDADCRQAINSSNAAIQLKQKGVAPLIQEAAGQQLIAECFQVLC